jgi:hypothetical protein
MWKVVKCSSEFFFNLFWKLRNNLVQPESIYWILTICLPLYWAFYIIWRNPIIIVFGKYYCQHSALHEGRCKLTLSRYDKPKVTGQTVCMGRVLSSMALLFVFIHFVRMPLNVLFSSVFNVIKSNQLILFFYLLNLVTPTSGSHNLKSRGLPLLSQKRDVLFKVLAYFLIKQTMHSWSLL